jgi:hypothetical protein
LADKDVRTTLCHCDSVLFSSGFIQRGEASLTLDSATVYWRHREMKSNIGADFKASHDKLKWTILIIPPYTTISDAGLALINSRSLYMTIGSHMENCHEGNSTQRRQGDAFCGG